ncbi:hypothetical protein HELRODRAFT_168054 [Helobdella robusta]|uniref:Uncharacterized protein n=1 Tax=Helobdella robusta TaxID=6412 RepID=T1F042_HELRO|nr:hypothetical protein HELRODRAFT_168054 [Helobdella robusta]ESO10182.1 hypothetical protein HELRODRAFT_168054 [Helobdella robusta]
MGAFCLALQLPFIIPPSQPHGRLRAAASTRKSTSTSSYYQYITLHDISSHLISQPTLRISYHGGLRALRNCQSYANVYEALKYNVLQEKKFESADKHYTKFEVLVIDKYNLIESLDAYHRIIEKHLNISHEIICILSVTITRFGTTTTNPTKSYHAIVIRLHHTALYHLTSLHQISDLSSVSNVDNVIYGLGQHFALATFLQMQSCYTTVNLIPEHVCAVQYILHQITNIHQR